MFGWQYQYAVQNLTNVYTLSEHANCSYQHDEVTAKLG